MPSITISRQMCSGGEEIASALASKLGWEVLTRSQLPEKFLQEVATPQERQILCESAKFYHNTGSNGLTFLETLSQGLRDYAGKQSAIYLGFGSQLMLAAERDALHVRIIAPDEVRRSRLKKQYRVSDEEAAQILARTDRRHKRFVSALFGRDSFDPNLYSLTLNTGLMPVDECVTTILAALEARKVQLQLEQEVLSTRALDHSSDIPVFKHPAELEFARLLDMYHIEWKYEPKTFPIEWDEEGNITSAFSPDFYLVAFDTYIELTTMNQKYVTAKNKKVRRLRELYPGINIKIVYKKDFQALAERFHLSKGD